MNTVINTIHKKIITHFEAHSLVSYLIMQMRTIKKSQIFVIKDRSALLGSHVSNSLF